MIRRDIIQCFRGTDAEPNLDQVAAALGLTREALIVRLKNEPPIEDIAERSSGRRRIKASADGGADSARVLRRFGDPGLQWCFAFYAGYLLICIVLVGRVPQATESDVSS